MLIWAIKRAGLGISEFLENNSKVKLWIDGEKLPTIKQLEEFSRKVYIPFGYLLLDEPPVEQLPIPYFRTNNAVGKVHINIYDSILILQQRQEWLRDYLIENNFRKHRYVGKFHNQSDVDKIVQDIRNVTGLKENWAAGIPNWTVAQNHLIEKVEDCGIIVVFNGVVENNNNRVIPVDECRGFVLVDEYAPFMFINNSDFKSAQMFTILHELAHIWTGYSAGFDFRKLQPAADPVEQLCDRVAAEFLVPEQELNRIWNRESNTRLLSRYFKVSEIVIARRLLDTGKWSRTRFLTFYNEYKQREFQKKDDANPGGNFYATSRKRISLTFASHVNNALQSGQLLYRDACKLIGLKGDTFSKFFKDL